ncbi:lipopolysaccharide biosynthesis protein, partial [Paenibacillus phytohabitans]|uniref:lipopolysaccharide biosynthesis protein n=1 Tax=Paenibacillus phytohabitans TaxID=2654978 RepID=UPI00300BB3D7
MPKFLKTIFIYFFGNVFAKLISILLLPLYTNYITPSDFGYYDFITTIIGVIVPVCFVEIWSGVLRYMYDSQEEVYKRKVFATGIFLAGTLSIVFVFLFIGINHFIQFRSPGLIFLYALLVMIQNIYQSAVRGLGKNKLFVYSGITSSLGLVLTNIILISYLNLGLNGLLLSLCLSTFISILLLEIWGKLLISIKFNDVDFKLMKNMFLYCSPLIINSASYWFLAAFNRIVIINEMGVDYNGIYAIASRFSSALNIFISVFTLAWQESAFSSSSSNNRSLYYTKTINLYIKFLGGGMLVLIPLTYLIFPYFTTSAYAGASSIIPLTYLGTLASALSSFLGQIFGAEKKTKGIFYTTICGSVVSVVAVFTLIPYLGLHAAALSVFLGFFVTTIARVYYLNKSLQIK